MWKTLTREMKDSGIEWIGEIPKDWKVRRLRFLGKFSSSGINKKINKNEKPIKIVNYLDVYNNETFTLDNNQSYMVVTATENQIKNHLLQKGDLIFTPSSETTEDIGVSALVTEDLDNTAFSYHVLRFIFNIEVVDEFKKYLTNNMYALNVFSSLAQGSTRKTLNRNDFKDLKVFLPPLKEQKKISSFLDQSIKIINQTKHETELSIIELKKYKQSLITEAVTKGLNPHVEMKDSGIEWIGKIPEHWSISRIKNEFTLNKGLTITKSDLKDKGIPVINYGEIHSRYGFRFDTKIHPVKNVDEEYLIKNENSLIKKGDFIFADTSEDLEGAGNFTCYIGDAQCFAGSHTVVLKPRKNINHLYYSYLFESLAFRAQIQEKVQGIKVFSITQGILKPLILIIPTEQEQKQIVTYLDEQTSRIDKLIADKTKIIEELENYKKSLIYEYVTGKKEA